MYEDPFKNGRIYLTVAGVGNTTSATLLFYSDNAAASWTFVGPTGFGNAPVHMTSAPSGLLYQFGWTGTSTATVTWFNPTTGTLSGGYNAGNDLVRFPGLPRIAPSEGISRVGTFSDGDYVRIHYPYRNVNGDYGLEYKLIRWGSSVATIATNFEAPTAIGRSIVGATTIETDRLDWSANEQLSPAVTYWYEVATNGTNGNYGPMMARYRLSFDMTWSSSAHCLSLSGGACRTWSTATDAYGDYQKGSFWFDAQTGNLDFLALWAEQSTTAPTTTIRTNVVTVRP